MPKKFEVSNNERTYTGEGPAITTSPWCTAEVFNVPRQPHAAEVEQAEVGDHSTVSRLNGRQRNWGVPHDDRAWLPGQKVSGGRANFGVVLPGKTGESVKLPVGQEKPTVS